MAYIQGLHPGFDHFSHQDPLSIYVSVRHQRSKDVTKIEILLPTSNSSPTLSHQQHNINNITITITR